MCHQFVTGEWMVTAVDVAKASAVAAQSSGGCGYRRRRVSAGWAWSTCRRLILHASPSRASRCEWRVAPSVFSRKLREERNSPRRASKCICNRGVMQQPLVPRRQPREARANRKRRVRLPRAASGVVADVIEWPLTCIWPHRGTKGRNLWGWGGGRVCWDRQDFRFMLAQLSFLSFARRHRNFRETFVTVTDKNAHKCENSTNQKIRGNGTAKVSGILDATSIGVGTETPSTLQRLRTQRARRKNLAARHRRI